MPGTPRAGYATALLAVHLLLLADCSGSISPLQNKIAVGREAYVVFAADADNGAGDLFAVSASGGPIFRITYSRLDESAPALSPDGSMLGFIRRPSRNDSARGIVWVMNLLNGAERRLPAPVGSAPRRLAWAGTTILVEGDNGRYYVAAPPASGPPRWVEAAESARADTLLSVWVGEPAFARVVPCAKAGDLCLADSGRTATRLVEAGRDAVRWTPDSVGYLVGEDLFIRPLGGGLVRRMAWAQPPPHPRQMTFFAGAGEP